MNQLTAFTKQLQGFSFSQLIDFQKQISDSLFEATLSINLQFDALMSNFIYENQSIFGDEAVNVVRQSIEANKEALTLIKNSINLGFDTLKFSTVSR